MILWYWMQTFCTHSKTPFRWLWISPMNIASQRDSSEFTTIQFKLATFTGPKATNMLRLSKLSTDERNLELHWDNSCSSKLSSSHSLSPTLRDNYRHCKFEIPFDTTWYPNIPEHVPLLLWVQCSCDKGLKACNADAWRWEPATEHIQSKKRCP